MLRPGPINHIKIESKIYTVMDREPSIHSWTVFHSEYGTTELSITHEYYFAIIFVKNFVTLFQNIHLMTYGHHISVHGNNIADGRRNPNHAVESLRLNPQ